LAAVEHFTWGQASERAKARAASHGGVDTELAVGAANGIVIDNGAAINQHSLMERGIGIHNSSGEHNWSYPDSVDRFQGFTGEIVRVLMNCCS
jgi:hypothetical protein